MRIKHINGSFYNQNSDSFGAECDATEYTNLNHMPDFILDETLVVNRYFGAAAVYYPRGIVTDDAIAENA